MRSKVIAEALSLASTANSDPVDVRGVTPWHGRRNCTIVVGLIGLTTGSTLKVQGSDDGTNWTDLATVETATAQSLYMTGARIYEQMRCAVTKTGSGAGTANVYIIGEL